MTSDAPQAPAPDAPDTAPGAIKVDAAVGLHAMPDGTVAVSIGWCFAGWAMCTVLVPVDGADILADQIKEAVHKARNPLISGPEVAHLIGRIPRNEH